MQQESSTASSTNSDSEAFSCHRPRPGESLYLGPDIQPSRQVPGQGASQSQGQAAHPKPSEDTGTHTTGRSLAGFAPGRYPRSSTLFRIGKASFRSCPQGQRIGCTEASLQQHGFAPLPGSSVSYANHLPAPSWFHRRSVRLSWHLTMLLPGHPCTRKARSRRGQGARHRQHM